MSVHPVLQWPGGQMAIAKCQAMILPMYSRPSKASARFLSQCSTPTAGHGAGVPNRHVRHTGKVGGGPGATVHGTSCQDSRIDSLGEHERLKADKERRFVESLPAVLQAW